ncbi:hypothetical protein A9Q97_03265 [Rhodospirillales bacterium 47_12_T64]|nr:hypothetical protein A9Q97_03265 [Rhodospirillales bacterium 47_12_T64]
MDTDLLLSSVWTAMLWVDWRALFALVAVIISWRGYLIARKSISIAEENARRQEPLIKAYLSQGGYRVDQDKSERIYEFLVSVSNRSDRNNSITQLSLRIFYTLSTGIQQRIEILCDREIVDNDAGQLGTTLTFPTMLDSQQAIEGRCFFRVKNELLEGMNIDKHQICFKDNFDVESSIDIHILQEKA